MNKILVIGAGSWGTALANLLSKKGNIIYLWEFNEQVRNELRDKRENTTFLPGVKLDDNIHIIDDYNSVANDVFMILLATPTQFVRNIVGNLIKLDKGKIIVNVAKGIEIGSLKRISEIVNEQIKEKDYHYVLLAGPTHAEEVSLSKPTVILSVCEEHDIAIKVQKLFSTNMFRVYTSTDVIGAELAGALKNCVAIVAGISDGLGYGDNTKAAIMTRAINEMIRIGKFYKAKDETFMGLTGLGDLIVTCTSKHSRNRYLGEQIGKGRKFDEIIKEMKMVCEGAYTIKALKNIIEMNNLNTPIFIELYNLLYEGTDVSTITETFMTRDLKSEF